MVTAKHILLTHQGDVTIKLQHLIYRILQKVSNTLKY